MSKSITEAAEAIAKHEQSIAALVTALGGLWERALIAAEQFRILKAATIKLERAMDDAELLNPPRVRTRARHKGEQKK